jgi:NitT/TauT family transport system permease protein
MKIIKKSAPFLGVALFWVLLWQLAAWKTGTPLLLPSPLETLTRLWELAHTSEFFKITAFSLLRVFAGALSAVIAGTLIAALCARFKIFERLLSPIVTVARATPVASFIILAMLWIGSDALPSFISFLMVFPIVFTNVLEGISHVSQDLLEMARLFRLSPMLKLRRIYMPSVAPYFVSAARSSLGLSWKAGISAEVLAFSPDSIGKMISQSKNHLETVDLFAWTAVIIILSLGIEFLFSRGIERLGRRIGGKAK